MTPAERIRRCLGRWEPSMVPMTANEGYARLVREECEGAGGLEVNTDQLIAKLDELIAATRSAAIPANMRWLSAESMAAMLDMSPRQFAERLACKPGFPKPAREGHPRWNVAEVHEWMRARRDERVVRRKAA